MDGVREKENPVSNNTDTTIHPAHAANRAAAADRLALAARRIGTHAPSLRGLTLTAAAGWVLMEARRTPERMDTLVREAGMTRTPSHATMAMAQSVVEAWS